MKVPLFVTLIGGEAYEDIKDLVSPELPSYPTYDQLRNILINHYSPKKLLIAERYKFYKCVQENSVNVTSFLEKLKKLSKNC